MKAPVALSLTYLVLIVGLEILEKSLLGGNLGPGKKYLAPPPKIPRRHPSRLPPPFSWETQPPLLGFSIKKPTPLLPGALDSPFPSPEKKKIKNIRNAHQV